MPIFRDRDSGLPDPAKAVREVEALLRNNRQHKQVSQEPRPAVLLSEELLETYQGIFLMSYFKDLPTREQKQLIDIRDIARSFRDHYMACVTDPKHLSLSQALEITSREAARIASYLTLEGLARYANERFERAVRNVANTPKGSAVEIQHRGNADYWSFVEEITKEAYEMKD